MPATINNLTLCRYIVTYPSTLHIAHYVFHETVSVSDAPRPRSNFARHAAAALDDALLSASGSLLETSVNST